MQIKIEIRASGLIGMILQKRCRACEDDQPNTPGDIINDCDLAGNDPTSVITQKAVSVVLDAMQQGWTGPPFDPFRLAGENIRGVRAVTLKELSLVTRI